MAQKSSKSEGLEVQRAQINTEAKSQALWPRLVGHLQSLLAMLVALTALGMLSLFFFVVSVTSVFSGWNRD
jgi:hypothetical protein